MERIIASPRVAKWSAFATLLFAGIYLVLLKLLDRFDDGSGKLSVLAIIFMVVGFLAMLTAAISLVSFILCRQQTRPKDDNAA